VASLFEIVAEPHRRQVLDLLREGDRSVGQLVDELDVAQPTVSKHLKALREAGLVVVRPDAQRRWYRLRAEPLRELDAWLAPYRRAWSARLDALEAHLDTMEDR
jgi:DNA-binding transcriptional ArsR family regulator